MIVSGKYGVVNGVSTVRSWTLGHTVALAVARASNTRGGTARRKGVHSWSGSYQQFGAQPIHYPGDFFTFLGYTAPDTGELGTAGVTYGGQAIVDSIAITWDWTTAAIISQTVNFSGHLVLTEGSSIVTDDSDVVLPEVHGTKVQYGEDVATAPTLLQDMTTASFTMTSANQAYVNSSTYDATTQKVWTGRTRGTFDWTAAITMHNNSGIALPPLEAQLGWRLFMDATTYWQLLWGRPRDLTGITVDNDSGAIITATMNIDKDGHKVGTGIGSVTAPDGTVVWPLAIAP